jgi:hypothetical protein
MFLQRLETSAARAANRLRSEGPPPRRLGRPSVGGGNDSALESSCGAKLIGVLRNFAIVVEFAEKNPHREGCGFIDYTICFSDIGSLIHAHAAHVATHSSTRWHCRHLLLLFGLFNDRSLGSQQQ